MCALSLSRTRSVESVRERGGLWTYLTAVRVNPPNLKCETLPILSLRNQYSRNFHLSWLGFWVAFTSWFAFSPLVPEAVSSDLGLTAAQLGTTCNSNIVSLCATLIVRLVAGPLVDRYGPRKVMAALLVLGAIPSGLAGLVSSAEGLSAVRFFIGILGATFVPCQAWTTTFFDKKVVGQANALAAGWGNSGGGFTFLIMVGLYNQLRRDGLSKHSAWRAAFAIVPVPLLLFTALLVMVFGTDHPAGKWSNRHDILAAHLDQLEAENIRASGPANEVEKKDGAASKGVKKGSDDIEIAVFPANEHISGVDTAVSEPLTLRSIEHAFTSPLTWLPMMAYFSTFGFELALDANLATALFSLYKARGFDQTEAGYIASIFGLLNVFSRPTGGYLSDVAYRRLGVPGKKWLMLLLGFLQGTFAIGLGLYIEGRAHPSLAVVIVFIIIIAVFNEAANGANFALVPHCNPNSNGAMCGLVGACANLGGVIFAIVFRFQPTPIGKAIWLSGILGAGINSVLAVIPVPRW
ncbi:nitrate transporter [Vararia minispora EC-137]|uniref:Nitrate transporter n=1 Tax=Vararia minispora EC-137 TaxID=1314806 RepID=A0ACB8QUV2_9AGAM|nr:nitrate transporter [Vararia minispora EC-137]